MASRTRSRLRVDPRGADGLVDRAAMTLSSMHASPRCDFWADSISYTAANLDHVVGHREVTDAYLASLAASRGGRLATFDHALVNVLPDDTELIPETDRPSACDA